VLYIGVTSNLVRRIWLHKQGLGAKFTQMHNLKYLLFYELFDHIEEALDGENNSKIGTGIGNSIL